MNSLCNIREIVSGGDHDGGGWGVGEGGGEGTESQKLTTFCELRFSIRESL